jgi:hypothetical protein
MGDDWEDRLYSETYRNMYAYVEKRRREDPDFSMKILREMIDMLYDKRGLGWAGKSRVQEIRETATISAYESYLISWDGTDD